MPGKVFNFADMRAYDFSSIYTTSTHNCFGCDCIGDECDMVRKDLEEPTPKNIPDDKYKNATPEELLQHVAVTLDRIAASIEFQNKILLEQTNNRNGW